MEPITTVSDNVRCIRCVLGTSLPTTAAVTSPHSSSGQDVAATPAPRFRAAVVTPLAPDRYRLQVTLTRETHEKLRRAQALAGHAQPDGDVGSILDSASDAADRPSRAAQVCPYRATVPVEPGVGVLHLDVTYPGPLGGRCGVASSTRDAARSSDAPAGVARPRRRVPSRRAVCGGRHSHGGQHPAALPRAQPV